MFEVWRDKGTREGYVRVLYNGADITPRLQCRSYPPQPANGMCTLTAFAQQVENMLQPYTTYEEACGRPMP